MILKRILTTINLIIHIYYKNLLVIISIVTFLFLFFLLSPPLTNAQPLKIKSIEITGNKHFSQAEIRKALRLKEGDTFSYEELNNNLKNVLQLYSKYGFYLTKILPPNVVPDKSGKNVNIKIQILENQKLEVADIHFSGNRYFSDEKLKSMISTKKGQPFSIEKINDDLHTTVDVYGERGYPFCEAILDSFYIDNDKISVYWQIEENDFVRISELVFEGNKITKDKILRLILNFQKNEIYKNSRVELAEHNLLRKQFIESAKIRPISKSELLVQIKEKQMNHFQGVLGLSSAKDDLSFVDRLTGFIDFSFMNIAGTDRDINLSWKKLKKNSSQFNISYKEPFILNQQISAKISLKRKSIDTIYVYTDFQIKSVFLLRNYNKIGLSYNIISSLLNTVHTRKNGVGTELVIDRLDNPINPHIGYSLFLAYNINWKSKKSYNQKVSLDTQHIIPISKKSAIALLGSSKLLFITGDTLSQYDLFTFGGYNDLRGFIDNQFVSAKFGVLSIEYRYLFTRSSRLFTFLDYAYYLDYDYDEYKNLFGVGFGVSLKSRIGIIKIDYGIGHQDGRWTNPLEGTIHFGIETGF